MPKPIFSAIIIFSILLVFVLVWQVNATSESDIIFPVAELGDCADKESCKKYCDDPDNFSQCFAFGKKHNLIRGPIAEKPAEEVERLSKVMKNEGGPGGCRSHEECEAYCGNISNIDACVTFAERHNLIKGEELNEMKKIRNAINRGTKTPGDCQNKEECENYCFGGSNPDSGEFVAEHLNECIDFGIAAGFMTAEEAKIIKKTGGRGPGGCRGRACETYCDSPANQNECFDFAVENGLIDPQEAKFARKVMQKTGCRGREECEKIMQNQETAEQIFEELQRDDPDFNPASIIPNEEINNIKSEIRTRVAEDLGRAPEGVGDCVKSKLEAFLNSPDFSPFIMRRKMPEIMDTCFKEAGGFPGKDGEFPGGFPHDDDGANQPRGLFNFPPQVADCLGREFLDKLTKRFGPPSAEDEERIRGCFEKTAREERGGPVGLPCQNEEECVRFCTSTDNPEMKALCEEASAGAGQHDNSLPPPPNPEEIKIQIEQQIRQGAESEEARRQFEEQFQQQFEEQFRQEFEQKQQEFQQQFQLIPQEPTILEGSSSRRINPNQLTSFILNFFLSIIKK